MTTGDELPIESAEELYENAPCGYLTTTLDGTIARVNRTFEEWTGLRRGDLLARRRFQDLLAPGARIYHETHYAPLLRMQGAVREIAAAIVCADGSRLPVLLNSVLVSDRPQSPGVIRTTIFDARDRRRYEQELMRARRREHEIALLLQRSLMAGRLPDGPHLDIAATYRPGVADAEVGGDWHDAFWLDDDRIGLVVGDVVGKGIEAAATMGQLRSATRALASTGFEPGRLLDALDAYAVRHEVGALTTVVYAEADLKASELRLACAGHPPALVVDARGEARFVWEGRSPPLCATARARPATTVPMAPGSHVLLYTDGLFERRDEVVDDGLDRLLATVRGLPAISPSSLTIDLPRALDPRPFRDDVCILAARIGDDPGNG